MLYALVEGLAGVEDRECCFRKVRLAPRWLAAGVDEAEVRFPFDGVIEFEEPETEEKIRVDATSYRREYVSEVEAFREHYRRECMQTGVDYVELDTSMQFDKALMEYLLSRRGRF